MDNTNIHREVIGHGLKDFAFTILAIIVSLVPILLTDEKIASVLGFFGLGVASIKAIVEVFRKLRTLYIAHKADIQSSVTSQIDPITFSSNDAFKAAGITDVESFTNQVNKLNLYLETQMATPQVNDPNVTNLNATQDPNYIYPTSTSV